MQGLLQKQNREVKTITSRNIQTSEDLQKRKIVLDGLNEQIDEGHQRMEVLLDGTARLLRKRDALENDIQVAKKTLREKTDEFLSVSANTSRLKRDHDSNKATQQEESQKAVHGLVVKKEGVEKELRLVEEKLEVSQATLDNFDKLIGEKSQEFVELGKKLSGLEEEITARVHTLNQMVGEEEVLKEQITASQKKVKRLASSIADNESQCKGLSDVVDSLEAEKIQAERLLQNTLKEVKTAESKVLKISQREERVNELSNKVREMYQKAGVAVEI